MSTDQLEKYTNMSEKGQSEVVSYAGLREPESLRNLSQEELAAMNKKLVRKIDLLILPTIGILYILNYIDRQNLGAAKLEGIEKDLHLSTAQFASAISILFAGYLPFMVPSNLLITKIPRPGMYICCAVVIWGAISACTAAVKNYSQLLGVRAVLGMVEAVCE
jgi:MFS family permease